AATIDTGGTRKVYNSANKIFDLSDTQPLGMMIYGNLEFMGLPFEGLVKEFRNLIHGDSFDKVTDCMNRFKLFLQQEVTVNKDDENQLVSGILLHFYQDLYQQI